MRTPYQHVESIDLLSLIFASLSHFLIFNPSSYNDNDSEFIGHFVSSFNTFMTKFYILSFSILFWLQLLSLLVVEWNYYRCLFIFLINADKLLTARPAHEKVSRLHSITDFVLKKWKNMNYYKSYYRTYFQRGGEYSGWITLDLAGEFTSFREETGRVYCKHQGKGNAQHIC